MDGRLALYSGAVFAGVLLAGALVIEPGVGDSSGAVTTGDPDPANTSIGGTGQSGDNRGFVSRLTSFVRGDDDDDGEYEDGDDDHEDGD